MFNIILLGITSFLTDVSSEMVYPLLPVYLVSRLGVSPALLGLIEGFAESLSSLLKVFSGYFSDKLKSRKPLIILGYASSALGKFFLYISTSWLYVLAGRVIDRFGKGVRTAPRDALIAEGAHAARKGAAFGLHRAMDTLGAATGIIIAYFLVTGYKGDFKNVFLFSLIPAFLGVVLLFFVREKRKETKAPAKINLNWNSLDKKLKIFLIFTFIFTLGNTSNQFLLLRAKGLGSSIATVILLYLVYNITYALAIYPASRLSDKIGRKTLLVSGYLFYGLVYLGFAINNNPYKLWFLFVIYGLYMGFTEGVEKALIADLAPADLRGTAIGMHAALVGVGLLPASLFAGLLWKLLGPAAPFYFGGFMGILSSLGLWLVLKDI